MTFQSVKISYDGTADEYHFHTDITVNGNIKGPITMSETTFDAFHWDSVSGSGEMKSATVLKDMGDDTPIEVDEPLTQVYNVDVSVKYVCSGDSLTLNGVTNGKYLWTYSYMRQGATA